MLLAIDCGNTNIVFAIYDGDEQRASWRISSDSRRSTDEYVVWLTQLMTLKISMWRHYRGDDCQRCAGYPA